MGNETKIAWCHHTYNPWMGCRKVAPECDNCYIVHQTPLRVRSIVHGPERHRCAESTLRQPFSWNRKAIKDRERRRVFCLSLGDWADGEVPDDWRDHLFQVIKMTPQLDWLLLTKRPKLALRYLDTRFVPLNVWMGVSAGVDPEPIFDIPARIHFLSCEPMLRPMDEKHAARFSWIIFGGESDPSGNARPCDLRWIRRGLDFCADNGIPAFVKQLGANPIGYNGTAPYAVEDSHGGDMSEWPEDLRVRDFPDK
jgi:protein gp37